MKKEVSGCRDCPFSYNDYDDFSTGKDTLLICTLSKFKKTNDHVIDAFDSVGGEDFNGKTPEWCLLKVEPITIEFKN